MPAKINVILLADVKNVGRKNQIISVSPSFASNVLFAKGQAKLANQTTIANQQAQKQAKEKERATTKEQWEKMIQEINSQ